eukprot:gene10034-18668_t
MVNVDNLFLNFSKPPPLPPFPREGQKEKLELADTGLGKKKVTFSHDGDAAHVTKQLEKIYPKLQGCGGFEILRSQGTKETLRLLIPPHSGYSVISLRDLSGLGSALGYIRPIQMNLSTSKVSPQDPMMFQSMESYSVKCLGCLEDIPIDQLREHHKKCISSNNQEVHGASTKKEFYQAIVDTQVQIVLDESQWDRSTPIQLENKLTLIQWLLQYDVLIKREKAIKHFGKGLATLGLSILHYLEICGSKIPETRISSLSCKSSVGTGPSQSVP